MSSELSIDDVVICVPAKNEADKIRGLLASLASQSAASPSHPLKVVIICNNTRDGTADIARSFASHPSLAVQVVEVDLPTDQAHVGTARRLAMDHGAAWLDETIDRDGVLISTDADAIAPTTWVAANLAALRNADVVGGRLIVADDAEQVTNATLALHETIDRYWTAVRDLEECLDPPAHDPAPRHGDHTGASLALRVSLYRRVGGVPTIPSGEDNALVAAIETIGGRIRHCPEVSITVSAREEGRADTGMAMEMARRRTIAAKDGAYELPTAGFWRARLLRRAAFRAAWTDDGAFANAIAYVAHSEASRCDPPPPVEPVDKAIADLEAMARDLRRGKAA